MWLIDKRQNNMEESCTNSSSVYLMEEKDYCFPCSESWNKASQIQTLRDNFITIFTDLLIIYSDEKRTSPSYQTALACQVSTLGILLGRPHTCQRTYILPRILLLSFFFRPLIFELAERNSTKIGHMLGSVCNLKMRVQNLGYPLPLQKPTFWTNWQLNGNFNGLYLRCVKSYKGSPMLSHNDINFGPQMASNWTVVFIHPP